MKYTERSRRGGMELGRADFGYPITDEQMTPETFLGTMITGARSLQPFPGVAFGWNAREFHLLAPRRRRRRPRGLRRNPRQMGVFRMGKRNSAIPPLANVIGQAPDALRTSRTERSRGRQTLAPGLIGSGVLANHDTVR